MTKALNLGVNGQDGSYLAEFLLGKGYEVIGWIPCTIPVSLDNIQHILDKVTLIQGGLLDQNLINACLDEYRPDEINNLVSPSSQSASWDETVQAGEFTAEIQWKYPKRRPLLSILVILMVLPSCMLIG